MLVNSDATTSVNASADVGAAVASATVVYPRGPSLTSTTGITFAGAPVTAAGSWSPRPTYRLTHSGNVVTVPVPAASAVVVTTR